LAKDSAGKEKESPVPGEGKKNPPVHKGIGEKGKGLTSGQENRGKGLVPRAGGETNVTARVAKEKNGHEEGAKQGTRNGRKN